MKPRALAILLFTCVLASGTLFPRAAAARPEDSGPAAYIVEVGVRGLIAISPSWEDCANMAQKFNNAMDEIHAIASECKDSTPMQVNSRQDIGPACRQWAGAAANSWWCVSLHPPCIPAEESWYRVALNRDSSMRGCYEGAAAKSRDKNAAEAALSQERQFYSDMHFLAEKWQPIGGAPGRIIRNSMDEIKKYHLRTIEELEELVGDIEDYR